MRIERDHKRFNAQLGRALHGVADDLLVAPVNAVEDADRQDRPPPATGRRLVPTPALHAILLRRLSLLANVRNLVSSAERDRPCSVQARRPRGVPLSTAPAAGRQCRANLAYDTCEVATQPIARHVQHEPPLRDEQVQTTPVATHLLGSRVPAAVVLHRNSVLLPTQVWMEDQTVRDAYRELRHRYRQAGGN